MEKYLRLICISICVSSTAGLTETIDLGTLEIDGEIRRPKVQFYQPQAVSNKSIKSIAEKKLNELESLVIMNLVNIKNSKEDKNGK